jgi:hypothetical protein
LFFHAIVNFPSLPNARSILPVTAWLQVQGSDKQPVKKSRLKEKKVILLA